MKLFNNHKLIFSLIVLCTMFSCVSIYLNKTSQNGKRTDNPVISSENNNSIKNNNNNSIKNNNNNSIKNNNNNSIKNNNNNSIKNNNNNSIMEKSKSLTDELIVFYNNEMDLNGACFIDPLPRETIENIILKGLKYRVINIKITSQEIIQGLKDNYYGPGGLPKGIRNHTKANQKRILRAYFFAFVKAKRRGYL